MRNTDGKGFTLGTTNRAKSAPGAHLDVLTMADGARKLTTVAECCGARLKVSAPVVGWYPEFTRDTRPAHRVTGWTGAAPEFQRGNRPKNFAGCRGCSLEYHTF